MKSVQMFMAEGVSKCTHPSKRGITGTPVLCMACACDAAQKWHDHCKKAKSEFITNPDKLEKPKGRPGDWDSRDVHPFQIEADCDADD